MKITQTTIVFVKNTSLQNGVIDLQNSFGSILQLSTILKDIRKPVEAQIQAFSSWTPINDFIPNPIISQIAFDNKFSVFGDPTKAQIAYDGSLQFADFNPIPTLANAMAELLGKSGAIAIKSIGINISGVCEVPNGKEILKGLLKTAPISNQSTFLYPSFTLTYQVGNQAEKITLKLLLDENGNDILFRANFNHDLLTPNSLAEWKVFINHSQTCFTELQDILSKLILPAQAG